MQAKLCIRGSTIPASRTSNIEMVKRVTQSHELRATHLNGCIGVSLSVILRNAFLNVCRESLILLASNSYIKPSFPVRARLPL